MTYIGDAPASSYTPPPPPVVPPPPPPPPDDVDITTAYYVKSDGSDSDDGTELNPFATIAHVLALPPAPGTGIIVKGGSPLAGFGDNHNISLTNGLSGASGAPITLMGAPGEGAQIDLEADGVSDDDNYLLIGSVLPMSHWAIKGLELLNGSKDQNGLITISATSGLADDWLIREMIFHKVGPGTGNDGNGGVYFGSRCGDRTIEWCQFFGPNLLGDQNVDGNAIQTDHALQGGGIITIRYNLIVNYVKAIQIYGDDADAKVIIDYNSFKNNGRNIDLVHYATAQVRNNFGTTALESSAYNLADSGEGVATKDHNVWGGTFNVDYTIATPTSALTASSTGGPVGAIDNA